MKEIYVDYGRKLTHLYTEDTIKNTITRNSFSSENINEIAISVSSLVAAERDNYSAIKVDTAGGGVALIDAIKKELRNYNIPNVNVLGYKVSSV